MATALIMPNLAGGESVDDLKALEAGEGFCSIIRRVERHGLRRKERRELERRWRKEKKRQAGKAFIPESNEYLRGFCGVNRGRQRLIWMRRWQRVTRSLRSIATRGSRRTNHSIHGGQSMS